MSDTSQPQTQTSDGATAGESWRSAVAPEYRKVAEKFLTPSDVVRSYAELERKLGKAITPPGENTPPEERERFFERLGRPKRVEDYTVALPADLPAALQPDEGGLARQQRFLAAAHEAGLTQAQAQAAIDWYYDELAVTHGDTSRVQNESAMESDAGLRRDWGRDYDRNVEYGRRAMAQFGDIEAIDRLEDVLGTAPVLRMMARIGRALGEASTMTGTASEARLASLKDELKKLLGTKDYWTNDQTQRRVREIHEELHGKKPIIGAPGRGF